MKARPAGFTLIELLIVVVLSGVILTAAFQTLIIQQRSFRFQSAVVQTQQTNRVALAMLGSELREVSAADGDLVAAATDSIAFRALRKVGFVCSNDSTNSRLNVWEIGDAFEVGDSLLVFADDDPDSGNDDGWIAAAVTGTDNASCGATWESASTRRLTLSLASADLVPVRDGALVRSFVRMSYGLFQNDGTWILGRRESGGDLVELIGPLASSDDAGLRFVYFDTTGAQATPNDAAARAAVERIRITVRGSTASGVVNRADKYVDSLSTEIFLRNN